MGSTVHDWTLSRVYGPHAPIPSDAQGLPEKDDAYGNTILTVTEEAQEWNLSRSSMYSLTPDFDGYFSIIDGYDTAAEGTLEVTGLESSVTDSTGKRLFANQEEHVITTRKRHVLSVKAPDATASGQPGYTGKNKELRVIKKIPGDGRH